MQAQAAKGATVTNRLACLVRTGWGIPLRQCIQLTSALVHSRVNYASVFWHTGPPNRLQRIDDQAYRFALGVFRTHPTPFLRHDTYTASAGDRLDAKTDTAVLRLLSMPDSNPAAKLVQAVHRRNQKTHRSTIHHALAHPLCISGALTRLPDCIDSREAGTPPHAEVQGLILPSKEEITALVNDNVSNPPPHTFIAFSNGSHVTRVGAGAATAWYNPAQGSPSTTVSLVLNVRVGNAQDTTPYQAKLNGFELAVANARAKAHTLTNFFWFFTDNQKIIRDLAEPMRAKAGMNTRIRIQASLGKLIRRHPGSRISILWCPSKTDVTGMQAADAAEKAAVSLPRPQPQQRTASRRN